MGLFKKMSPRRSNVRKNINGGGFFLLKKLEDADTLISIIIWLLYVALAIPLLSFNIESRSGSTSGVISGLGIPYRISKATIVVLISIAAAFYIKLFQKRIITNHVRAFVLAALFLSLFTTAQIGYTISQHNSWITGSAVAAAIILSISYNQRFAIGMSIFYCFYSSLITGTLPDINVFFMSTAGAVTIGLNLKEIRTRMKLLEVGALSALIVLITTAAMSLMAGMQDSYQILILASRQGLAIIFVTIVIQALLPFIEKHFSVVTSMTLLDYSDANQPLLKRLAIEAPGTYSHSLLLGSIAESAAETIGRNGLLCRVGAYYHDIGKINKPLYFVENEIGSISRHKELSPAMSQLIIIGHVKDGIELAKEYNLPTVLRQFIETHHGTTLVEYFYSAAKKKKDNIQAEPSESEFRYPGPRPKTKEAAIVMLTDAAESAVRSLTDVTPGRIEAVVHNMSMKRLQDGQFDECDLTLRELSQIEESIAKSLTAHYHSRIAYPTPPDEPLHTNEHGD